MKLERLHEYTLTTAVIGIGMGLALAAGQATGTGQMKSVGIIIAGICVLGVCLACRTSIWLIIPLCWQLTGGVPISKLPFSVRDGAVLLTFGSFLIFYALKQLRYKPRFELLDALIIANLLYLVTVYLRNPVGANWLGSQLVGGKPYFDIFIAFLAYAIIVRAPIDLKILRRLPIVLLFGYAMVSLGSLAVTIRPSLGDRLGKLYSAFAPPDPSSVGVVDEDMIGRKPLLSGFGEAGLRLFASYFNPITFLSPLHPLRFLAAAIFMVAILLSGFRSALFGVFIYIGMSCYFRKRLREVAVFGLLGAVLLTMLALGNNRIFHLPLAAQRALSFLPGEWDYVATSDAQASSEWRKQIWRMVLTEDQWIRNKWLGDGFGFTSYQLSIMTSRQGYIGGAGSQEAFLVAGNYHSGPLSTIRYAGVAGLALFLPFMVLVSIRGFQLIKKSVGTSFFPVALFVGMPIIYFPIPFIFVAGGYDSGLTELLFSAGLIRLIERAMLTESQQKETAAGLPAGLTSVIPIHRGATRAQRPYAPSLPKT